MSALLDAGHEVRVLNPLLRAVVGHAAQADVLAHRAGSPGTLTALRRPGDGGHREYGRGDAPARRRQRPAARVTRSGSAGPDPPAQSPVERLDRDAVGGELAQHSLSRADQQHEPHCPDDVL